MSSDRLNVIALISGGKDSFFSILHVLANGHRVVALANLHPSDTENEDTNSFMYQTVGHTVIPLYERALALPLFRQPIAGSAVNTSSTYALEGEGDETEDLIPLLRRIREAVPEANSVSTGAILSTYQRTRVESVAVRMGLVPLSYLWQFPYLPPYRETSLLGDMRAVGQEARIVKVCSGGLDEECLWSDVGDVRTVRRLRRGMRRFRSEVGAVLGEGGEFETLALKGPRPLWKGVIEVGEKEVVKEEGGSSFVKLRDVKVVELGDKEDIEEDRLEKLRIPDFLDVEFKTVLSNLSTSTKDDQPIQSNEISTEVFKPTPIPIHNTHSIHETPSTLHISNMISSQPLSTDPPEPTVQQLHSIFHALRGHLTRYNLNPTSIVSSLVLLRSMSDFAPLNPIYASFFPTLNPAARITIATGTSLPPGINIALSVIVDKGPAERRRILHVQSRSYWAPANIGPYSQAVGVPVTPHLNTPNRIQALNDDDDDEDIELKTEPAEIVHIAGQIPLVPATMTPVSSSLPIPETGALETQAALALQHLFRIGRAIGVDGFGCAIAFLSACGVGDSRRRAGVVGSVWRGIHAVTYEGQHGRRADEGEDGGKEEDDVWDRLHNRHKHPLQTMEEKADEQEGNIRPLLPNWARLTLNFNTPGPRTPGSAPACFVVEVEELPRGVDVEITALGFRFPSPSSFSSLSFRRAAMQAPGPCDALGWEYLDLPVSGGMAARGGVERFAWAPVRESGELEGLEGALLSGGDGSRGEDGGRRIPGGAWTVYATTPLPESWVSRVAPVIVGCRRVWDGRGGALWGVLIVRVWVEGEEGVRKRGNEGVRF